ncbi:MAG: right-handed parallel beta-helix repeat-containing protein [Verrucomicrobiota bacterium]
MKLDRLPFFPVLLTVSVLAVTADADPPLAHGTLEVTQLNAANGTNGTSVTTKFSQGTTVGVTIDESRTNRGDYFLDFAAADDVDSGVMLTSVAQNGRDNSASGDPAGTFHPTSSIEVDGTEYFASIHRFDPPSGQVEFNINTSFAWFPFDDWLAGHAQVSTNGGPITSINASLGLTFSTAPSSSANLVDNGNGIFDLDLVTEGGSSNDGILLVNGGKNEDNFALSEANSDGTFTLYVHDNGVKGAVYEQDSIAFAYIPQSAAGLTPIVAMGRVTSGPASGAVPTEIAGGNFTVNKLAVGRWVLTVPGHSPDTGTLLLSAEGGEANNVDNFVSSEYQGSNQWIIESRTIQSFGNNLEDGDKETEPMFSFAFFSNRVYVDLNASGNKEGTSWTDAFLTLQDALDKARPGQEILVAEGTYYPDEGENETNNDRDSTFTLSSYLQIFGGFSSGDTFAQRDPATKKTFLSGDIDQNDGSNFANTGGNAFNVAIVSNADSVGLDGLTFIGANNESTSMPSGGVRVLNTDITLTNCTILSNRGVFGGGLWIDEDVNAYVSHCHFEENQSTWGGAVFISRSALDREAEFTDCIFQNNNTVSGAGQPARGGACYVTSLGSMPPEVEYRNCLFQSNSAEEGGAIWSRGSAISNCQFTENSAVFSGGAIFNSGSQATLSAENCLFSGNQSSGVGGAFSTDFASPSITNCAFIGNHAGGAGGALRLREGSPSITNCSFQGNSSALGPGPAVSNQSLTSGTFSNCVFWNNAANGSTSFSNVESIQGSVVTFSNCLIHNTDLSQGTGDYRDGTNPANNPRFVEEVDPLAAPIVGGDLRFFIGSPLLDNGLNIANTTTSDLGGNTRIQNTTIDLGAYESAIDDLELLWLTDFDNDGLTYGIEVATGLDPDAVDPPNASERFIYVPGPGGQALVFGRNQAAPAGTILKVMRSTDLTANSFTEIVRFTPTDNGTDTEGGNFIDNGPDIFSVYDNNRPKPKAYYRLEATYKQPGS